MVFYQFPTSYILTSSIFDFCLEFLYNSTSMETEEKSMETGERSVAEEFLDAMGPCMQLQ